MPKIKMPKSSPSIDMTPMVDLAFLLVTFFMLAASIRPSDPVDVDIPTSISDMAIPANVVLVTVDAGGRVFFKMSDPEAKRELINSMMGKYKSLKLTEKQVEEFTLMETFGCTVSELPEYLDLSTDERRQFNTPGIPYLDSTKNQLKDWIDFGNRAAVNSGRTAYEVAQMDGLNPDPKDFVPKFILRVDSKTLYANAQKVIDVFRDLELNNLNFITSLEMAPL
jgi:biopolymer transport protein ExbD